MKQLVKDANLVYESLVTHKCVAQSGAHPASQKRGQQNFNTFSNVGANPPIPPRFFSNNHLL